MIGDTKKVDILCPRSRINRLNYVCVTYFHDAGCNMCLCNNSSYKSMIILVLLMGSCSDLMHSINTESVVISVLLVGL